MKSRITHEQGTIVVAFEGAMDLWQGRSVRQVLLDCVDGARTLVVDLSAVTMADSSAIASLVEAFQTARKRQVQFVLVAVTPAVMRVLELVRLDRVFTVHESLGAAVAGTA